ncbi:MAG: FGGY family carbohydrate kinase [Anaerococcus sp.]|nr:FGGY family carbohydrate kinase [Anaerococcus sp.]
MKKYIMALDAGTTSNRCIIFDKRGRIVSLAQKEFSQIFPHPGWVEHDATEIWSIQLGVCIEALAKINGQASDIAASGASANNFLMQFQADMIQTEVQRPKTLETTALGAAYLAGLGVGFWESLDEIKDNWSIDKLFEPQIIKEERDKKYRNWKRAVKRSFDWAKDLED